MHKFAKTTKKLGKGSTSILAALVVMTASAADITWKGGGDTSAWSDGSNWEGGVAPSAGDSAVIPEGKTATWAQTDAAFMNDLAGIELNGDMEVSGMTVVTSLTVPLSGSGVFRGLDGGENPTSASGGIGLFYRLALANNNENFTGTFAFTNCGVKIDHNLALGGTANRCTLIWKSSTGSNHRRLILSCAGPHNANMFLAQPLYYVGMIFAVCDTATYIDGDVNLTGPVQFHANARAVGLHLRGRLANSGGAVFSLNPNVYLEGDVDIQYLSGTSSGNGFYLGGGNGNIKNMGRCYVGNSGIHFTALNVIGGSNPGNTCNWIRGNNNPLRLYLDGNDQNWYNKPAALGFIVNSTKPATLRMMNFVNAQQTFNTADCLTGYASFDVCATNKTSAACTTTLTTTHCTTAGGLLCGAGTFVVGNSAAAGVTTSFSNLTSLVTYDTGTMNIHNTDINPENGVTNLSVLGTSTMTFASCVTQKVERAYLSSGAQLSIAAGGMVKVSKCTCLDGRELMAGVYGKVGGIYPDGSAIPAAYQLSCLTGDGWLETDGRKGFIVLFY